MRKLFQLLALCLIMMVGFTSCSDDAPVADPTIEVNYINLHGAWQLTEWNGAPLEEGAYCYIVFDRKEQTYKMYQKFDSMYARLITGSFALVDETYAENGKVKTRYYIVGNYDFGNGDWNNAYIISDMMQSGTMVWTAEENPEDVSVYTRCSEVPEEIIAEVSKK